MFESKFKLRRSDLAPGRRLKTTDGHYTVLRSDADSITFDVDRKSGDGYQISMAWTSAVEYFQIPQLGARWLD